MRVDIVKEPKQGCPQELSRVMEILEVAQTVATNRILEVIHVAWAALVLKRFCVEHICWATSIYIYMHDSCQVRRYVGIAARSFW